jgi:TetR/AcrR family transcriptional repressor of nem operon
MTKGEETRQFIIEKAAPIFNMKGISATAMSDIMEATKLSKGILYVHFENKESLASSAVDHNMNSVATSVKAAMSRHTNPKDMLFAYLDVFASPTNYPIKGGCPILNFGTEADDTNEEVRKKVGQVIEAGQARIANIIQQGIKEGVFNPQWNYKEFATMMFAMIEGGVMICRVTGDNRKMKIIIRNLKKMIEDQVV